MREKKIVFMAQSNLSICLNKGQLNTCYGLSSIVSFFNKPNPLFHTDFMGTFNNLLYYQLYWSFQFYFNFLRLVFTKQHVLKFPRITCTMIPSRPLYHNFEVKFNSKFSITSLVVSLQQQSVLPSTKLQTVILHWSVINYFKRF